MKYYIVSNKTTKAENHKQAAGLLADLESGGSLVSVVAAGESVHYILATADEIHEQQEQLQSYVRGELSEEDAQIIRDNLDTTHKG